jgi:large subunit ribosomal protein L25
MEKRGGQVELTAQKRQVLGKQVSQIRRQGWVPGVIYGHGFEPLPLQFELRQLKHVLSQITGSQLVSINIEGQAEPQMALVREVQVEPITRMISHVDFHRVTMTERIRTQIPLTFAGTSPAVARNEGILLHGVSAIDVECLPGDLVQTIEVDLSSLATVDAGLTVGDLAIPENITVLTPKTEMVVRVAPLETKAEVEEAAVVEAAAGEVETVREAQAREKQQEEGAE